MKKKRKPVSRRLKTIDVNGPVASRFVNKFVDLALRDIVLSRKEMKAKNGKFEIRVSYPLAGYPRPLEATPLDGGSFGHEEALPFREVEFSLTAKIK